MFLVLDPLLGRRACPSFIIMFVIIMFRSIIATTIIIVMVYHPCYGRVFSSLLLYDIHYNSVSALSVHISYYVILSYLLSNCHMYLLVLSCLLCLFVRGSSLAVFYLLSVHVLFSALVISSLLLYFLVVLVCWFSLLGPLLSAALFVVLSFYLFLPIPFRSSQSAGFDLFSFRGRLGAQQSGQVRSESKSLLRFCRRSDQAPLMCRS